MPGLMDWITLHNKFVNVPEGPDWWSGSFSQTFGGSIDGNFAGELTHNLGSNQRLTIDVASLIQTVPYVGKLWEAIFPIVVGMGGEVDFVYGPVTNFTYGGPESHIRRGPKIEKTTNSLYGTRYDFNGPGRNVADHWAAPVDVAVSVAIGALSVLMNALVIGMHITIKCLYVELAQFNKEQQETGTDQAQKIENLNSLIDKLVFSLNVIEPRLKAFIKWLEEGSAYGDFGKRFLKAIWPITTSLCVAAAAVVMGAAITVGIVGGGLEVFALHQDKMTRKAVNQLVDACASCLKQAKTCLTMAAT